MNNLKAAADRLAENLRDAEETINDRTVRSMVQDEARKNIPAFSTALAALRDMMRRQEGCVNCEKRYWYFTDYRFNPNYCPMCGRKLEVEG